MIAHGFVGRNILVFVDELVRGGHRILIIVHKGLRPVLNICVLGERAPNHLCRLLLLHLLVHYEVIRRLVEQVFLNVLVPHLAYRFDTRFFFLLRATSSGLALVVHLVKLAHVLGTIRGLTVMRAVCGLNTELLLSRVRGVRGLVGLEHLEQRLIFHRIHPTTARHHFVKRLDAVVKLLLDTCKRFLHRAAENVGLVLLLLQGLASALLLG